MPRKDNIILSDLQDIIAGLKAKPHLNSHYNSVIDRAVVVLENLLEDQSDLQQQEQNLFDQRLRTLCNYGDMGPRICFQYARELREKHSPRQVSMFFTSYIEHLIKENNWVQLNKLLLFFEPKEWEVPVMLAIIRPSARVKQHVPNWSSRLKQVRVELQQRDNDPFGLLLGLI